MDNLTLKIEYLLKVLKKSWSLNSSSKWTMNNPAKGQCGVTALVVNDIYGGEIFKTPTPEGWHFYNRINNKYFDLTESQFTSKIIYLNMPSSREEAFLDTNGIQYNALKQIVYSYLTDDSLPCRPSPSVKKGNL
ncbi:hypothetical protein [Peribacillus sp. NPDC097295]|uniref:YunG family protein n=1 Tax=Peribacillus sp. NPDC097295 TaxID=3364402 RepID=UPI00381CF16A